MELLLKNNQCVLLHLTTSSLSYRNTLLPANAIKHGLLPYTQQRERERERELIQTSQTDWERERELIQTSQTDWERYRWSCCSRTTNVFSYISQHHRSPTGTHSCLLTPLNTACSHTHSRERERERERVNTDVTDRLREIQMELLLKNNQCVLLHLTTSSLSYRNTLLPANAIKHGLLPYTQQRERERERES